MASRSGGSTALVVSLVLVIMLAVGLFITTVIFFSGAQKAQRDLANKESEYREIIRPEERQQDSVRRVVQAAGSGQSMVGYLLENSQNTINRITGTRDTFESMNTKLEDIEGAGGNSLIQIIRDNERTISQLRSDLESAVEAREAANRDRQVEIERINLLDQRTQQAISSLEERIGSYKSEIDSARAEIGKQRDKYVSELGRIRRDADEQAAAYEQQIAQLDQQIGALNDELRGFRAKNQSSLMGVDEAALVDGRIIGVNANAGEVTIDRGRRDHVQLGMSFAVYTRAAAIAPDEAGEYAAPKARIEITRVAESSAVCRIVSGSPNNPVISGDVIANAVYDPSKTYTFVVFGDFDADGDGVATPMETTDVRNLIESWGGKLSDEITGDVDFLVLGASPVVPPTPPIDAPGIVIEHYRNERRRSDLYEQYFRTAESTAIPVLNQNRLMTLIGKSGTIN